MDLNSPVFAGGIPRNAFDKLYLNFDGMARLFFDQTLDGKLRLLACCPAPQYKQHFEPVPRAENQLKLHNIRLRGKRCRQLIRRYAPKRRNGKIVYDASLHFG